LASVSRDGTSSDVECVNIRRPIRPAAPVISTSDLVLPGALRARRRFVERPSQPVSWSPSGEDESCSEPIRRSFRAASTGCCRASDRGSPPVGERTHSAGRTPASSQTWQDLSGAGRQAPFPAPNAGLHPCLTWLRDRSAASSANAVDPLDAVKRRPRRARAFADTPPSDSWFPFPVSRRTRMRSGAIDRSRPTTVLSRLETTLTDPASRRHEVAALAIHPFASTRRTFRFNRTP
jgi:hypothetical protein